MIGFIQQNMAELFAQIPVHAEMAADLPEIRIVGITNDSRNVQPGFIFVAQVGGNSDGHKFIPQAIQKGAAVVVGTQEINNLQVPYIRVDDSREVFAHISAAFYGFPARQLTVIGVTGTDGKTTTANLIYQILMAAGLRVGIISTINALIGDATLDTGLHVTTPEAPDIQRYLARMLSAGLTHVVLELTSHGLAQHRVTGCEFDIGVVTNITHEHLDFHGTYEAYRAAKAQLFTSLENTQAKPQGNPRLAVLNQDDLSYNYLSRVIRVRQAAYSTKKAVAGVWAEEIQHNPEGMNFFACGPNFRFNVSSPLVGDFNVSNCLAAITATMIGLGVEEEAVRVGIAGLRSVPGRMERINLQQNFQAIVDFAHTPNALQVTLEMARKMTPGKVIVVFGSAGLRDRQKRRMMAEVAAEKADITILTAEDPRTESLDDILAEMADAARKKGAIEGQTLFRIKDRGEAMRKAVNLAAENDLVIACGKGHEQSMCFGLVEYPWDDRTAVTAAISERLGLKGPQMPYLPTQDFPMI